MTTPEVSKSWEQYAEGLSARAFGLSRSVRADRVAPPEASEDCAEDENSCTEKHRPGADEQGNRGEDGDGNCSSIVATGLGFWRGIGPDGCLDALNLPTRL